MISNTCSICFTSLIHVSSRLACSGLVMLLLLAACGGDDDDTTTTAVTNFTTATTEDVPVEPDFEPGQEALAFFRTTEEACAQHAEETSNDVLDPALFAEATIKSDSEPIVIDGDGTELLVDLDAQIITGLDGPESAMPRPYSFSCPPDLYVGTIDD